MNDHGQPALTRSLTRRRFLIGAAITGVGVTALDGLAGGWLPLSRPRPLRWMSPRGTLDVMDDYHLWTAKELGYFRLAGVDVELLPGPQDPQAMMQALAAGEADVGFPSPATLVSAVDRGLPLVSVFQTFPQQVFSLAVPRLSPITTAAHLAGRTIAVGSLTWRTIVDPMLVDAGVEVRTVRYVEGGPGWNHLLDRGRADAALVWDGLRADWEARGIHHRSLPWERWSRLPSNSYVVRRDELDDPVRRDLHVRFLRGAVMGLELARRNPRAAAQLAYRSLPDLRASLSPQRALDWMLQIARGYGAAARSGHGWGFHYHDRWQRFSAAAADLGYAKPLRTDALVTNSLVAPANSGDRERVMADALGFELDRDFKRTRLPASTGL